MKLESTIRVRPDLLYIAPLLNVVLLLMVFFLLNSNLVMRSGIRVDLPPSGSRIQVNEHAHIVTITGDKEARVLLNNLEISPGDLTARLAELTKVSRDVVINADSHAPMGLFWRIVEQIQNAGCFPYGGTRLDSD